MNAFGGDGFGELFDDSQRIASDGWAAVGVIFIDEGERSVGLDTIGKIGIAAGDKNEVALERSFFVDRTSAINDCVKAVVRAKLCEDCAFGESFSRGSGNEKFVGVERVDDFPGGNVVELDAEIRVGEFGAVHHFLNAIGERGSRLRAKRLRRGYRKNCKTECNGELDKAASAVQVEILQKNSQNLRAIERWRVLGRNANPQT